MIFERRTNYAAGADFERKVRDHAMHDLDATYVVRSAGSRGIVDLVIFFAADDVECPCAGGFEVERPNVWLVQCKRDGKITAEDRELLLSLAAETGGTPYLAWPVKVGRAVHVEMEELSENESAPASEIHVIP